MPNCLAFMERFKNTQNYGERPQKKNKWDLLSMHLIKNCLIYFRQNTTNTILISKMKPDNTTKSYDSTPFMTNPTSKMLNNISKFVCVSLFFISSLNNQFIPNFRKRTFIPNFVNRVVFKNVDRPIFFHHSKQRLLSKNLFSNFDSDFRQIVPSEEVVFCGSLFCLINSLLCFGRMSSHPCRQRLV